MAEKKVEKPKRPGTPIRLASWEQRFKELEAFKKKHGHCNVPKVYQPNPALGRWVHNVRNAKKQGTIAAERVRGLDTLGFCWEWEATWKQRINDLRTFKNEHGHCNIPFNYPPNPILGRWVSDTRQRKKMGKLSEEIIRCLNALGFRWTRHVTWEQHIHDLKAFKEEHGHCDVPLRYPPNPALGLWVNGIRQGKKRGTLAEDKTRSLDALGFCWAMKQRGVQVSWEQRINDLKAFKKEHGHCNVSTTDRANLALGRWVDNVRQRRKRGELAEDRIRTLDALGFCWGRQERSMLPKESR